MAKPIEPTTDFLPQVMRVEHHLAVRATCPVDGTADVYDVVVRTGRVIKVAEILAVSERLAQAPVFQEALTCGLASELGAEVQSTGWHSGVRTVVVCGEIGQ